MAGRWLFEPSPAPGSPIRLNGVINERTAKDMARGAAGRCRADVGLSATGVAGPDCEDGHTPGTVWLGLALPACYVDRRRARPLHLSGDRAQIRSQTIDAALAWLIDCLGESTASELRPVTRPE